MKETDSKIYWKKMRNILCILLIGSLNIAYAQSSMSSTELAVSINKLVFEDPVTCKKVKDPSPNWASIERKLSSKYGQNLVREKIVDTKLAFYEAMVVEQWNNYADVWVTSIEGRHTLDTVRNKIYLLSINNMLFNQIFKNATDKQVLLRAAKISLQILNNPYLLNSSRSKESQGVNKGNYIDTYANLLYKGGQTAEAIEWQTKAVEMSTANSEINTSLLNTLNRMKAGKSTWK